MKFLLFLRQFLVKMGLEIGLYYKMKYLKQATHLYSRINTMLKFLIQKFMMGNSSPNPIKNFERSKLNRYLHEIDIACEDRIKTIISQLVKQENVTEELKATNQMEQVGKMSSIKKRAEEIVLSELIYVQEVPKWMK